MYVCMCVCVYVCMCEMCMYVCICVCVYVWMHFCTCVCIHLCTRMYVCVYVHVCTYIYTYTYVRTYVRMNEWMCRSYRCIDLCQYVRMMHACMHVHMHACSMRDAHMMFRAYGYIYTCTHIRPVYKLVRSGPKTTDVTAPESCHVWHVWKSQVTCVGGNNKRHGTCMCFCLVQCVV